MAQKGVDCYISLCECLAGRDDITVTEKNETALELCRDHLENNAVMFRQKKVSGSTEDNLEVATGDNIHREENEIFQKGMMMQPNGSASIPVPYKPAHSRLSSSGSVCRICHEDDNSENLISPCECTGTLGLVHKTCLEMWLSTSNKTECEICNYHFNTSRQLGSVWEWFQTHRGFDCHQGLYGDLLFLLILTPPCLVSIYLCGLGSAMYMRHGLWEGTGLAILCFVLFATYLLWIGITLRFHMRILRRWQRMNQMIRLMDVQCSQHAGTREQRTEVNNNGHAEEGNNNAASQVVEINVFV